MRARHGGQGHEGKVWHVQRSIDIERTVCFKQSHMEARDNLNGGGVGVVVVGSWTVGVCLRVRGRGRGDETGRGVEVSLCSLRNSFGGFDGITSKASAAIAALDIWVEELVNAIAAVFSRRTLGSGAGTGTILLDLLACVEERHDAVDLFLELTYSTRVNVLVTSVQAALLEKRTYVDGPRLLRGLISGSVHGALILEHLRRLDVDSAECYLFCCLFLCRKRR